MTRAHPADRLKADVDAVARIDAVPTLLRVLCDVTGMGLAAVARVTDDRWIACAVVDRIDFGLVPGSELDVNTTLCKESRERSEPIVIEHASQDPYYREHMTPKLYGIESYVSVPIRLPDGEYFGNLCAIDPEPRKVADTHIRDMFLHFADMLAFQLAVERSRDDAMQAMFAARARSDLREQFVAVLGHDMRQPAVALAECSRALQASSADRDVFAATARIGGYARRLIGLIDDMLDLAKVDLGRGLAVHPVPGTATDRLLHDAVDELKFKHVAREIVVSCDDLPPITADRARLRQVVTNLVENALVHGSGDGVVRVHAARVLDDIVVTVSNVGRPIAPADQARLFEPFWRTSSPGRGEGIGLGLYICDQIVRAHGGRLEVDSDAAGGTHFVVVLPIRPNAPRSDGRRVASPGAVAAVRSPPET